MKTPNYYYLSWYLGSENGILFKIKVNAVKMKKAKQKSKMESKKVASYNMKENEHNASDIR